MQAEVKSYRDVMREHEEIATRAEPSQRYLNILSSLATGHLPWGVPWPGGLKRRGAEFVLCCGHTLTTAEANRLVLAGLLIPATTAKGEDGLAITDAGKVWLSRHWPCDPSDD